LFHERSERAVNVVTLESALSGIYQGLLELQ
jgi:hypothetical protein